MKISLTSFGTWGDVQPLITLAFELRNRGHEPHFLLPSFLCDFPRQFGFKSQQIGPDLDTPHSANLFQGTADGATQDADETLNKLLLAVAPQALQDMCAACADTELLVSSESMPLSPIIHELTGVPFATVWIAGCIPFWEYYRPFVNNAFEEGILAYRNEFRAQLGLSPAPDLLTTTVSQYLTLFPYSPQFLKKTSVWPNFCQITGFFYQDIERWTPDPELATFLDGGDPTVAITMGSWLRKDAAWMMTTLNATLASLGLRAVIPCRSGDFAARQGVHDRIFVADYVPYHWLYKRCQCLLHHGGYGSTAIALREGIPTVVIPHTDEQFALSNRMRDLGCASVVRHDELMSDKLAIALNTAISDDSRQTARLWGDRVRHENGVQSASILLEQFVEQFSERSFKAVPARRSEPMPMNL
jgi:UDP:flavonoid glycosyltransferase YjiC (YdhE family)